MDFALSVLLYALALPFAVLGVAWRMDALTDFALSVLLYALALPFAVLGVVWLLAFVFALIMGVIAAIEAWRK